MDVTKSLALSALLLFITRSLPFAVGVGVGLAALGQIAARARAQTAPVVAVGRDDAKPPVEHTPHVPRSVPVGGPRLRFFDMPRAVM